MINFKIKIVFTFQQCVPPWAGFLGQYQQMFWAKMNYQKAIALYVQVVCRINVCV